MAIRTRIPQIDELARELEELAPRMLPSARLFARSQAAISVKGAIATLEGIKSAPGAVLGGEVRGQLDELIAGWRALDQKLVAIDQHQFGERREKIKSGEYRIEQLHADLAATPRYEWDAFVQKLLDVDRVPIAEKRLTDEMVSYHPTPAWLILEMAAQLGPTDVLFDMGSGLGKVTLLTAWLSPARVIGVEREPAYHRAAIDKAEALGLASRIDYLLADVREVDYSEGTVFYFYHPFEGEILADILRKLEAIAGRRPISIWTLGKITDRLEKGEGWLVRQAGSNENFGVFKSSV